MQDAVSEFIHYRTYARYIPDEGRRETRDEAVDRLISFVRKHGKWIPEEDLKALDRHERGCSAMASRRLAQTAGPAAEVENVTIYNCSYAKLSTVQSFAEGMYILMCGGGFGFSVEHDVVADLPKVHRQRNQPPEYIVVRDSRLGWAEAYLKAMTTWFDGRDCVIDYSRIRPEGAPLKTMGGRASGPGPLADVMNYTRYVILSHQGKRLTTLAAHDIMCKVAECVQCGGVRRSSEISLSDFDDASIRECKGGSWWQDAPFRSNANNSAVYYGRPDVAEFMQEWLSLVKNGSGERGIFNRLAVRKTAPDRRKSRKIHGINPCVTADMWVDTADGRKQVRDLVGVPFVAYVNGEGYKASGFWYTGTKKIVRVDTERGQSLRLTPNHKVLLEDGSWKEAGSLAPGDSIRMNDCADTAVPLHSEERDKGWLVGSVLGDGGHNPEFYASYVRFWGDEAETMEEEARAIVNALPREYFAPVKARTEGRANCRGICNVSSRSITEVVMPYLTAGDKNILPSVEEESLPFIAGFLQGWFDSYGSVQGDVSKGRSIRLTSVNQGNLQAAQRMLARLGVVSTLYYNRRPEGNTLLPDGNGGSAEYPTQSLHELVISRDAMAVFAEKVGFRSQRKASKLRQLLIGKRGLYRTALTAKVQSVTPLGKEAVYDCTVNRVHMFGANGLLVHNCAEIALRDKQFCNLSEIVVRPDDTVPVLLEKIRYATLWGVFQSTLTDFHFLGEEWKHNCEEERLLGVSITGSASNSLLQDPVILDTLKKEAVKWAEHYSYLAGVPMPAAVTCVKPSGTLSLLAGCSPGLHPWYARHYVRRIRIDAKDPLFQMCRDQGVPHFPEVGQGYDTAKVFVLEFPVEAPAHAVTYDDVTVMDQLETWRRFKEHYTEHQPSCTIHVRRDEWMTVGNWVYDNFHLIGGLSFLPKDDHVYALPPYSKIDRLEYERRAAVFPDIDYSRLPDYEREDCTTSGREVACSGGKCDL